MPDSRDCKIILQQTAERIAASMKMCDDSRTCEIQATQYVVVSRKAIAHSMGLLAHANRRLY